MRTKSICLHITAYTAIFITNGSLGRAATTTPNEPFSVIYSSTTGRALVGVASKSPINAGEIANFMDCRAPKGASKLTPNDLGPCYETPNTRFVYNEQSVEKINAAFSGVFQHLYQTRYRRAFAANDPVPFLVGGAVIGMVFGIFQISEGFTEVNGQVHAGRGGLRIIGGSALSAIGLMAAIAAFMQERQRVNIIPPLEKNLLAAYAEALHKNPQIKQIIFDDQNFALTYDLLREAIIQSISQVQST